MSVKLSRVKDIFDPLNDGNADVKALAEVDEVFAEYSAELRHVFMYYATLVPSINASNALTTMSQMEFLSFCQDCRFTSKNFPLGAMDVIFVRVNRVDPSENMSAQVDRELTPREWLEALLRIAAAKYVKVPSIAERLRTLIQNNILPHACRYDSGHFRKEVRSSEVKAIINRYYNQLQKIFTCYAKADKDNRSPKSYLTISCKEFMWMIRDSDLLNFNPITQRAIIGLFAKSQQEEDFGQHGDDSEMVFTEFLEGICGLSYYAVPDPYQPLDQRLERFLSNVLIPSLKGKVKSLIVPPQARRFSIGL